MKKMLAVLLAAVLMTGASVRALDFPNQPVTLVCGWAAGGSSDLMCRVIAKLSEKYMGVTMNVVNRDGGNGAVSLGEMAARTAPDGYTMALCASGGFTTMPFVQDTGYTIDDFEFVTGISSEPLAVIVSSNSEIKSLQDIVDRYKEDKAPVIYGMSGSNGHNHMFAIKIFRAMGVEDQIIPYSGASGAITALLGGEVDVILVHPGMVLPSIASGEVKPVAMLYDKRIPAFPDVPTVEELGYGRLHAETYKGLIVPKATPPEVVAYLNEKITAIMQDKEYIDFLANNGIEPSLFTKPGEFRAALENDVQALWPLMEELKVLKPGAARPGK